MPKLLRLNGLTEFVSEENLIGKTYRDVEDDCTTCDILIFLFAMSCLGVVRFGNYF